MIRSNKYEKMIVVKEKKDQLIQQDSIVRTVRRQSQKTNDILSNLTLK